MCQTSISDIIPSATPQEDAYIATVSGTRQRVGRHLRVHGRSIQSTVAWEIHLNYLGARATLGLGGLDKMENVEKVCVLERSK